MSESKPRAWLHEGDGVVVDEAGNQVASVYPRGRTANLRLIAAAPEMLNLLKDMLEAHDTGETIIGWESARALICKAEGSNG